MRIAICDDDPNGLNNTKIVVEDFIITKQCEHLITLTTFSNSNDLLYYLDKHRGFDLLILDILMPGMNGIELASEIRNTNTDCKIIFLTTTPEFAVDSYKVDAYYYLLKPFQDDQLKALLNKVLDEFGEEKSTSIVIKEKSKLTRVPIGSIQYVESDKHLILFNLRNGEVHSCYGTMNEFCDILLEDKRFIKCHKSFIVNMNYVMSISSKDFIMCDQTLIPISRRVYQQVKNAYIDYFFTKGNIPI